MTKNKFLNGLIILTLVILFVGAAASIFFLIYNNADILGVRTLGIRTEKSTAQNIEITPEPSPTPPYNSFIMRNPNYVGSVEEINDPNQVVVVREDQSKIVLNLQPDIPIYFPTTNDANQLNVETHTLSEIELGDSISIYTNDKNILAIFVNEN